jgi:riboflavin kinase/FMN adenylyltransferase
MDGVHLGHQAVLGQLAEKASVLCLPTVVILFEPQPQEFFAKSKAPPRLYRFREKIEALRRYSVDYVLCLKFNERFAAIRAQQFIREVLVDGLHVRYLVVGDDFRFGYQREGDFASLVDAGKNYDFQVAKMHSFMIDEVRVSSTAIRQALVKGDIKKAEKYIGRSYRMSGRVVSGDARGRTIGFPTANIQLHRTVSPVQGVFAVEVYGIEGEPAPGVANVGTRPTVDGTRALLEVHLLDFDQMIYGKHVQVSFLHKIRDEKKFGSLDELVAQIRRDAEQARRFHGLI